MMLYVVSRDRYLVMALFSKQEKENITLSQVLKRDLNVKMLEN